MLQLEHLDAGYQGSAVVHDITFCLPARAIGCLLGPSGCGKTTLLRVIAGFESALGGCIRLDGAVVSEAGHSLAPERRGVGVVFQDLALFPHLTVAGNIAFGLRGQTRDLRDARVTQLLQLVGLQDSGPRYPHELSGGQQQRVALARALAPRPRLLLLDEPFSSLDLELRESLATEVRTILKQEAITALLVTHDQHEAFAFADHIAVMRAGRLEQQGDPVALYRAPATRFVAGFIGQGRLVPGVMADADHLDTVLGRIAVVSQGKLDRGARAHALLRPEDLLIADNGTSARVVARAFRGAQNLFTLQMADGSELLVAERAGILHAPGDTLKIIAGPGPAPAFAVHADGRN